MNRPSDLTVERRVDPIGIGEMVPRLSWRPASSGSALQHAYQVQANRRQPGKSAPPETLWDTGRVTSRRSTLVPYGGPPLGSRDEVRWRVRTWQDGDAASQWSRWSSWELGLLSEADWVGTWVGYRAPVRSVGPDVEDYISPGALLRREFELPILPGRARLYVTALGLYEAYINGRRVGDRWLTPGWTDYRRRIEYQTYDATEHLHKGRNVLAIRLGSGWYAGHIAWFGRGRYGDVPAVLCQLEAEVGDGTATVVRSEGDWLAHPGGLELTDIIMGERIDLREMPLDWSAPDADGSGWGPVQKMAGPGAALVAAVDGGVGTIDEISLQPVASAEHDRLTFDAARNVTGVLRLRVRGAVGDVVTLEHAEQLQADGRLYRDNLRTAEQRDRFTLRGSEVEIIEPRFTYHGFRYATVQTSSDALRVEDAVVKVLSSARRSTGVFESSNDVLNRLHANIVTSLVGNFISIPTDCPQRDERLAWTGDIGAFVGTSLFISDVAQFLEKWLADLQDAQLPSGAYPDFAPNAGETGWGNAGWADAGLIVPWQLYVHTGDRRVVDRNYDGMKAFLGYLAADHTDGIRDGGRHGDWLSLGAMTPLDFIGTAFLARSAYLFSRIAAATGHRDDAAAARRLLATVRRAFRRRFMDAAGLLTVETQTSYALAIAFQLLPGSSRLSAGARLAGLVREADYRLQTGFLGVPHVLPALSRAGQHDVAYRLALQTEAPSWGFQVASGATSIWERWDGRMPDGSLHDPEMNSFNHYAFGSIGEWLYRDAAGFRAKRPGFQDTWLHLRPVDDLDWLRVRHETLFGVHATEWEWTDGRLRASFGVPANTTATIAIDGVDPASVLANGKPPAQDPGRPSVVLRVGSGTHEVVAERAGA